MLVEGSKMTLEASPLAHCTICFGWRRPKFMLVEGSKMTLG
jgi:hypothetical protein